MFVCDNLSFDNFKKLIYSFLVHIVKCNGCKFYSTPTNENTFSLNLAKSSIHHINYKIS